MISLKSISSQAREAIDLTTGVIGVLGAFAMTLLWIASISANGSVTQANVATVMARQDRQKEAVERTNQILEKQGESISATREDVARTKAMVEIILRRVDR